MQANMDSNMPKVKSSSSSSGISGVLQFIIKFRTIVILLVLIAVFTFMKNIFIDPTNLLNMLKRMSYVIIAGFGMTFIITLAGLDLSVGSIAAIVGVGFALLVRGGALPVIPALLIMFVVALFLGFLNGFISVKGRIEPFLVTLATMNIYRGIALTLTAGKPVPIVVPNFADIFGNGRLFDVIPTPVLITIVFFLLTWFLFKKTKFGFYVRCIGGNPEAARVAGINVNMVKMGAYTLNGFYAFFSGLILAALMNSGMPDIGADLALDCITGVILGGTAIAGGFGSIWGTVGGCLIMASLNSGLSILGAQYMVQILVKGTAVILAVLMDNALKSKIRR